MRGKLGDETPALDVVASKLAAPPMRTGIVGRAALLEHVAQHSDVPIVSVVAPAGYGKTTFLAQWARADSRPFAWVSVDEKDNDPTVLLAYAAEALNRLQPVPRRVFDALGSPASSLFGTIVPRVASAFATLREPAVLVIDDLHLIDDVECRAALSVLADNVPAGSQLVLSGRSAPPVRVPRLRAEGRLLEFGAADLALSPEEAAGLLRAAGVDASPEQIRDVYLRTEGWAAGVYLASLALHQTGGSGDAPDVGGDDIFIGDYIESEFLARLSAGQRDFLLRASALERMSAPLCDAVLELDHAGDLLSSVARSNLLVLPLDHRGDWYRFHHLLRDLMQAELRRAEPGLLPALQRRAADWYRAEGQPEEAIAYAIRADDADAVAELLPQVWGPLYRRGRTATLERWFEWLEQRGGIEDRPVNAMNAAFLAMITGHADTAERWATAVDRWRETAGGSFGDPYTDALAATLRAMRCADGIDRMLSDADDAAALFAQAGAVPPIAPLLQGTARSLAGEPDSADAFLRASAETDPRRQSADVLALALGERAAVALGRHDWVAAEAELHRARSGLREAGVDASYAVALVSALRARTLQHRGDIAGARDELSVALRLRPLLTFALPHRAMRSRLAIVRTQIALGDPAGARTVMAEVDEILARRPHLGTLVDEAEELRRAVTDLPAGAVAGASSLTTAELRVLPMLATHLTYSEIASELYVSKNTVKSQAYSLFRKLGARSRGEAVARSRQLALLES
ncbi:LuxR C-terminal-related transcriptional regulator [Leifsonia poae]|uniref:LuxR C-terminal-related transcriptional regulator n=1 Tax=Leifsonia poae TaxID=110933 RepID=UPI003D69CCC0